MNHQFKSFLILRPVKIKIIQMKKLILILALQFLFTINCFACSCISQKFDSHFSNSDFVGEVKILKNYKSVDDEEYYRVDVLVRNIYKGNNVKSIYVNGYNESVWESSCDMLIPVGTRVIIFAKANENDQLQISMCSKLIYLGDEVNEATDRIVKVLETLKLKKILYKSIINKNFSSSFRKFLREQSNLKLKRDFAIYEVSFKNDLKVKCVRVVSGFKNKIDRKIKRYLRKKLWSIDKKFKHESITNYSKHFVIIYNNKGKFSENNYIN